jgi:hypothetical protein
MRNLLIILFAIFLLSLLLLLLRKAPMKEGFSATKEEPNYVLNLVSQLKRTSMALANPALWSERMALMRKSPTELARDYIHKQKARGH